MAIIDTSKLIVELAKKGMSLELQEKIMQLREEALELQEENLRLKTENLKLKKKEELHFKRKVYYREGDEVPLCPYCYEKSNLLIHLSGPWDAGSGRLHYDCSECGITYTTRGEEDFCIYNRPKK